MRCLETSLKTQTYEAGLVNISSTAIVVFRKSSQYVRRINYPTGFSLKDIVSWGISGMICLDEPSRTIDLEVELISVLRV